MSLLRSMVVGLQSLFRKEQIKKELDDELNVFLEMAAEEKMKQGMNRKDALRAVRLERGNLEVTKEVVRSAGWESFVETLWQDLRHGQRILRKSPGFAVVAVLTLALGIGATSAIFSVINAVLLRPLAMEDPSHVVFVQETWRDIFPGVAVGNFVDLKKQSTSFAELCASNDAIFNLEARELPERIDGDIATTNYFTTFGVQPIAGRVFTADEDKPGQPHVVVISERLWRAKLHSDPSIVGQPIRLNGLPTTVLGVMPRAFDPLLSSSDLSLPSPFTPHHLPDHTPPFSTP